MRRYFSRECCGRSAAVDLRVEPSFWENVDHDREFYIWRPGRCVTCGRAFGVGTTFFATWITTRHISPLAFRLALLASRWIGSLRLAVASLLADPRCRPRTLERQWMNFDDYFDLRGVSADSGSADAPPKWLLDVLPADLAAPILDLGCGFGRQLRQFREAGHTNVTGADVSRAAVDRCAVTGLRAELIRDIGIQRGRTRGAMHSF